LLSHRLSPCRCRVAPPPPVRPLTFGIPLLRVAVVSPLLLVFVALFCEVSGSSCYSSSHPLLLVSPFFLSLSLIPLLLFFRPLHRRVLALRRRVLPFVAGFYPSSLGFTLRRRVVLCVVGLYPSSSGCTLRRRVVPFIVGFSPSSLGAKPSSLGGSLRRWVFARRRWVFALRRWVFALRRWVFTWRRWRCVSECAGRRVAMRAVGAVWGMVSLEWVRAWEDA